MKISNPNAHRFLFCPSCGEKSLAVDSVKSFLCTACGFKLFINCAAAAMALIHDDQGRLLVTLRRNDPARGSLDLPGGFAEPGESIEACLIRELKEELNLNVTELSYLCSFPNTYPYGPVIYPITDTAFVCEVESIEPIRAMDDVAGFLFISVFRLKPEQFGMSSVRKTIEYLIKSWG